MVVYQCDLCGRTRNCLPKLIEQKEYDMCFRCWSALKKKLRGKGRRLGQAEITLLALQPSNHEHIEDEPRPGDSPKVSDGFKKPN